MTWLVRMELPKETLAQCRFSDAYAWHQAAWTCFPGMPDNNRDFLTRLDWNPGGCRLYILSRSTPVRPGWCPQECWAVREIPPSFLEHETYRFDLVVNPTRKIAAFGPDGQKTKNGRRLALISESDRRAWLERKGLRHGFSLVPDASLLIDELDTQVFLRKSRTGTHVSVRFRGVLTVTDKSLFQDAFLSGIGSAKAFGFGMLLLQPTF